ncbi:MAG: ThiF family adenylyltransferase [Rhodospirillaceae bacterium]
MDSQARYQRHTLIDWFSQASVRDARLCVVGAGAVGNEVLKCLALLGAGSIDVYDFDRIEIHNLTRSVLFRESDIGRNKAECAAARVRDLDPNVAVAARTGNILRDLDLGNFFRYSAVICCVDNFEARLRLNLICKLWQVDLINTGVDSRNAVIDTFPFADGGHVGCYECTLPPSVYRRVSQRYSCGGLKRAAFVEKRIPTTVITASLAGSFAASKALRLRSDSRNRSDRVFVDSISGISRPTELPLRSDCPVCAQFPGPYRRTHVGDLQADLARLAADARGTPLDISLPEQVILSLQCKACGAGKGQGGPLYWRASDYDSTLANCSACGAEGAVEIEMRDRLPLEALMKSGVSSLPLPFAMVAAQNGTDVLVF